MRAISALLTLCFIASLTPTGNAFSLLGPLKNSTNGAADPWQGKPYGGREGGLGYGLLGDIGGPMFIDEAYRWNVPVLYYGFDQSFLDYFGQDGVAAVERAFAILNALPPASEMSHDLAEFPLDTVLSDNSATQYNLLDLKSAVLSLVVEQLGLADPERFVWSLRNRQVLNGMTNYTVVRLNYDPVTLAPSSSVNGVAYNYRIFDTLGSLNGDYASAVEWYGLDPAFQPYSSVAGSAGGFDYELGGDENGIPWSYGGLQFGQSYTGLTRDDIGGLRLLLHPEHRQRESLLPDVTGTGTNASNFVDVALRGGVDKLTFQRLGLGQSSNIFLRVTNTFRDSYLANGIVVTQTLQRVVSTPDFLFRAKELGVEIDRHTTANEPYIFPRPMQRSDTSSWQNNAALNDRPGKGGPGIIRPPVVFTFNSSPGRYVAARSWPNPPGVIGPWLYGSFDGSPDSLKVYFGTETNTESILIDTRLEVIDGILQFESKYLARPGLTYRVEHSTNLIDWAFWYWQDNHSGTFSIIDTLDKPHRFYRFIKETWNQDALDERLVSPAAK